MDRYLATDGADGFEWEGAQCVILTTVGRKTGSLRRSPLIRIRDGERYLLVASMGGAPRNPSWYLNLVENPDVTIQDRAETHHLRPARPRRRRRPSSGPYRREPSGPTTTTTRPAPPETSPWSSASNGHEAALV